MAFTVYSIEHNCKKTSHLRQIGVQYVFVELQRGTARGMGIEQSKYTSFLGNLTLTRRVLEEQGIDPAGLFREVGLNRAELESNRLKRVPVQKSDRFFELAVQRSGDPCFGLTVAQYINPATFQQYGVGLLYSQTLRDFLKRFARFSSFMTTLYEIDFHDQFGDARLSLTPVVGLSETTINFDIDVFAAGVMKFLRLAFRPDYVPLRVNLGWVPPENCRHRYEDVFGCEVVFGVDQTSLEFEYFDLEKKFPAANKELARQNDQVVVDFLAKTAAVDLRYRVYSKLIEMLASGECGREEVAKSLNMSAGSLHAKLKKEGTSFQALLDETRKSLAEEYARQPDISLTEIAYMLGYTNSSNFSRAFKTWTGKTPRAYRLDALSC